MEDVKEITKHLFSATNADVAIIKKAYEFAEKAHAKHTRYSGEPYITHVVAVATMLAEIGMVRHWRA